MIVRELCARKAFSGVKLGLQGCLRGDRITLSPTNFRAGLAAYSYIQMHDLHGKYRPHTLETILIEKALDMAVNGLTVFIVDDDPDV